MLADLYTTKKVVTFQRADRERLLRLADIFEFAAVSSEIHASGRITSSCLFTKYKGKQISSFSLWFANIVTPLAPIL